MPWNEVMHKWKAGTLRSGGGGRPVTNREQAIAIMLSEKRKAANKPEYRARMIGGGVIPGGTFYWPGGGGQEGPNTWSTGTRFFDPNYSTNPQDYAYGNHNAPWVALALGPNSPYHYGQTIQLPNGQIGKFVDYGPRVQAFDVTAPRRLWTKSGHIIGNMIGGGRGIANKVRSFFGLGGGAGPFKGWSPEQIQQWHNAPGYQQVIDPATGNPYFGMSPPGGGAFGNTILNTNWVNVPGIGNVPMAVMNNPQASLNPLDYFGKNYGTGQPTQNVVGAVVGGIANIFVPGLGLVAGPAAKWVVRAFQQGGLPAAQQAAARHARNVQVSAGPLENVQFHQPSAPTGGGGGMFGGLPPGFTETNRFGGAAPTFLGPGGGFNTEPTAPGWFNFGGGATGPGFSQPLGTGGSFFQSIYNPHGWQPLPGALSGLGRSGGSLGSWADLNATKGFKHALFNMDNGRANAYSFMKYNNNNGFGSSWGGTLPSWKDWNAGLNSILQTGLPNGAALGMPQLQALWDQTHPQSISSGPPQQSPQGIYDRKRSLLLGANRGFGHEFKRGGMVPLLPRKRQLRKYGSDTTPVAAKPGEMFLTGRQQAAVMPIPGREHMLKPEQLAALLAKHQRVPLP